MCDLISFMYIVKSIYVFWCLFFFQAEDGIRDLVRSRGLGDVYKRQGVLQQVTAGTNTQCLLGGTTPTFGSCATGVNQSNWRVAVSYTHLTLPTSDLV